MFRKAFNFVIKKIKERIKKVKLQLKEEQNLAYANQFVKELYIMLFFCHYKILKLGITEEIQLIKYYENIVTIGLVKSDLYRDYTVGETRKICEHLNKLLSKFLQYECNRIGQTDFLLTYPILSKNVKFITVVDTGVELEATIKLNT